MSRVLPWSLCLFCSLAPKLAAQATHARDALAPAFLVHVSDNARGRLPCTGARLLDGRVLTARHCVGSDGPAYVRALQPAAPLRAEHIWTNRLDDLAVLQLPAAARSSSGLRLPAAQLFARLRQHALWVATFAHGITPARLVRVDERFVLVTAPEARLCYGDSGAPLLVRELGRWLVLGSLDIGDRECRPDGQNRFVRSDRIGKDA